MSEKKYTSGKAIDAEVQRLLDMKKKMVTKKTTVFMEATVKSGLSEKLVELSDTDVKELAKIIEQRFDDLVDSIQEKKDLKKEKANSSKSKKTKSTNQAVPVQPEMNIPIQPAQPVQPQMAQPVQGQIVNSGQMMQ